MNAIDFLIKEHEKVKKMLADIADDSHREETKHKMFASLCDELIRHEVMERTVWYPHFKHDKRLKDTVKHLLSEEKQAEKAIQQFDNITSPAVWEEKFAKFKQNVEHHAAEEEEELFPEVEQLLSEQQLEDIGKEMYEFKKEYTTSE